MNEKPLAAGNFNRLAKAMMDKDGLSYAEAVGKLKRLQLRILSGPEIRESAALQAALLTAVNTGKRAFLGGVSVLIPGDVESKLPWPQSKTLSQIVVELGGRIETTATQSDSSVLVLGTVETDARNVIRAHCSGWRGGIAPLGMSCELGQGADFALGGVLAGALGVAHCFLKISGIHARAGDAAFGFSLWRPDVDWLLPGSDGPKLLFLPRGLWFLGLGHLGQAYAWSLGLLPYTAANEACLVLQDYDCVEEANWTAGLVAEKSCEGEYKTRMCAEWLEARGMTTRIIEKKFSNLTRCEDGDPKIALCGFDSAEARSWLGDAGFDMVVECGIGGSVDAFDRITLHTFNDAEKGTPRKLWGNAAVSRQAPSDRILEAVADQNDCGILAETLANKAISSSFVGAAAGAMVVGEVLRALHCAGRCEYVNGSLRTQKNWTVTMHAKNYSSEAARTGSIVL